MKEKAGLEIMCKFSEIPEKSGSNVKLSLDTIPTPLAKRLSIYIRHPRAEFESRRARLIDYRHVFVFLISTITYVWLFCVWVFD